jgi:hypothetical protein
MPKQVRKSVVVKPSARKKRTPIKNYSEDQQDQPHENVFNTISPAKSLEMTPTFVAISEEADRSELSKKEA